jgi:WD40 repeat protein
MSRRSIIFLGGIAVFFWSCGQGPTASDTTRPWTIGDLRVRATREGFYLHWTATGDDGYQGRASHYDARYAASNLNELSWDSAHIISNLPTPSAPGQPDSVSILGIGAGPWEFAIKIGDDAGHWSLLSNVVVAAFDTIPPAVITDLEVRSTNRGHYLRWTAPGDDINEGKATRYDIRYTTGDLATGWNAATQIHSPPIPATAGHPESTSVLGIGFGPWEFGIMTLDESGNSSGLSNVVRTTVPDDLIPPAPVTDLKVDMVTEGSVVLRWTASGDDGVSGRASAYEIRHAETPITAETWASATPSPGPVPQLSGQDELFTLQGLQKGSTYYFALIVIDDVENSSELSNSPSAIISSAVRITFNSQYSTYDPDWSPNGQSIIYNSDVEIQPGVVVAELFAISAAGGNLVRYTSSTEGATQAAWSPDGAKIAFRLRKVLGVMDAQPEAPAQVLADHSSEAVSGPRWSPDGTRIAYVVTTPILSGQAPGSAIYTVPSTGGVPELLTGDYTWIVSGLDWSPNGTQIVYSSSQAGAAHVFVMPSVGGAATQLTNGLGNERSPEWSPDGSKIAYVVDFQEIRIVYATGANPTRVTFDPNNIPYRRVTWSPDGTMIAYGAQSTSSQITNIWKLRVK